MTSGYISQVITIKTKDGCLIFFHEAVEYIAYGL